MILGRATLIFGLIAVCLGASRPIPLPTTLPPTILPCARRYETRTTETGATKRLLIPCHTPDPCIWPRPYTTSTSRLSLPYPPKCCPILQKKLSTRTALPYPLPYPCFTPLPQPTKKPECAPCRSSLECLPGKCWGQPLKCTTGDYEGLLKCGFKDECDDCSSDLQCATKKCWRGKCVFDNNESKDICFSH